MGWEDRPYYRDRGYRSSRLGAFLSGTLPLYTLFGIRVCIHNAMIVFILGSVLLGPKWLSLTDRMLSMTALLLGALIHEYGHCIAARLRHGTCSEILLWPLGGLTSPDSPPRPGARLMTVLGGPVASGLVCLTAAGGLWLVDRHEWVPLNPLRLMTPELAPALPPAGICLSLFFWWVFAVNYALLLVNLLPIFPLDAGQLLQTLLWNFIGNERARVVACLVGMFGATLLGLVGLALWNWATLAIVFLSVWLFLSCYQERMILLESGPREPWQTEEHDYSTSLYRQDEPPRRRVNKRAVRIARKRARLDAAERERLDAILAKVSATGLASLGWRERRALRSATEKRRKHDEELKGFLED
jgi:stage IV sporulation protein FB